MKKNIEDMLKRAKRMIESMRVEDISSYFDVTMYLEASRTRLAQMEKTCEEIENLLEIYVTRTSR